MPPPPCPLTWALHVGLKIDIPFPAAVSLSGKRAERVTQSQVTTLSPTSPRPGWFGHLCYRPVPLLLHTSLLGCAWSSSQGAKNTSLPLVIHLRRSRQDFDLKGKAFPGIRLHETHAKRAPSHQVPSLPVSFNDTHTTRALLGPELI